MALTLALLCGESAADRHGPKLTHNPPNTHTHTNTQLPDVVERLRGEQAQIIAAHGPDLSRSALDAMSDLDAVIKEVQYLQPAGNIGIRCVLEMLLLYLSNDRVWGREGGAA